MLPDTAFLSPRDVPPEIQRLPKCNLHTHLEGSIRPRTLIELAQRQGVRLPFPDADAEKALGVTGDEKSLADYLAKISLTYPVLKDADALVRTCREAVEDAAASNVRYLELRAGPATHATDGLPVRAVIAAMLQGLAEGEAQFGVTCRLIVAALRHHDPAVNVELARAALEFKDHGVVGFDLAGDEARYPGSLHRRAVEAAREGGLGITIHAGEASGAEEVRYALLELGATRIGHGIHSQDDPEVIRLLRERDATLEICPTSNVHTATVPSIAAHPVRRFFDMGLRVTIGDDDPTTSQTSLSRELGLLAGVFRFSLAELQRLELNGLAASFLEEGGLRARLLTEFVRS